MAEENLEQILQKQREEYQLHFGALVEDFKDQVKTVAEGVMMVNERLDRQGTQLSNIDARLERIEGELAALRAVIGTPEKPNIITRQEHEALTDRLDKLESEVVSLKQKQS